MSEPIPTKPYFIRAIYEWCTDNAYTPYIVVKVKRGVRVPMEFVNNGEIVLNISFIATHQLKMDNEAISFKARFGEVSRDIYIPIDAVAAIYASENHQGMAFEVQPDVEEQEPTEAPAAPAATAATKPEGEKPAISLAVTNQESAAPDEEPKPKTTKRGGRKKPSFTIIK